MEETELALPQLERRIYSVRNQRVMLDSDLAELYGVETKTLNRAISRNQERFPPDFMFVLTAEEAKILKYQIGTSSWGGRRTLPYVFTEQGVAMLSSVLRSERAVQVNIAIMRAFVSLRGMLAQDSDLARRILHLEEKYDRQFAAVFEAIRQMLAMPPAPERRMGFHKGAQETVEENAS